MLLILSCMSPLSKPQSVSSNFKDTEIESFMLECTADQNSEVWTLEVNTLGWSSGGFLWLTQQEGSSGDSGNDTADAPSMLSERHPFYSVAAEIDGSADRLKLTLTAVADWRDAAPGSTTRWLCKDEETLTMWIQILNPSGNAIADCESWGIEGESCL